MFISRIPLKDNTTECSISKVFFIRHTQNKKITLFSVEAYFLSCKFMPSDTRVVGISRSFPGLTGLISIVTATRPKFYVSVVTAIDENLSG
jgi:hypothetical protein